MRKRKFLTTALFALMATAVLAAEGSLRGSPSWMSKPRSSF